MLRLYLIRHGESVNNIEPNFEKHLFDPPLTDLGQNQSKALAYHLKHGSDNGALKYGYDIQRIYTSPQLRALQTTSYITNHFNIRPEIWVKVHERGGVVILHRQGIRHHMGMTRSQILTQFPTYKIPHQITERGWWQGTPKLESQDDVKVRARVVATDLLIQSRTARDLGVALVSHGTFLNCLMQTLLRDFDSKYLHHNTGLSRIDIDRSTKPSLIYLNRISHLEQNWIS